VPLMMKTSGSSGGESATPSEGPAAATMGVVDDAVAKEATMKKRAADVDTTKEAATIKAIVVKAMTDRATNKVAADKAAADKDITDERATEEAAAMKTAAAGAVEKSVMESAGPGSTLAPVAGSKRAATPSKSTPHQKHFHGAWKQRYVVLF
jgi:membrane protein involved in colicin uptake